MRTTRDDAPHTDAPPSDGRTLQTIMLAIVLGLLLWNARTTYTTSVDVAVFAKTASSNEREILELRARVTAVELNLATMRGASGK